MGKIKLIPQDKKISTLKNMQSILKKRNKKKSKNKTFNIINKNELKKQYLPDRKFITKQNSTQKECHRIKKISNAKHTKGSDVIQYPKINNTITNVLQTQVKTNKTKHKRRRRGQKQNGNSDQVNNNNKSNVSAVKGVDKVQKTRISTKELKTLQKLTKKTIHFEPKTKTQDMKKINQKKMKQISNKRETELLKSKKVIKLNNRKIKIERLEEMLANKAQTKQVTQKIKKQQPLTLKDRMMTLLKSSRFRFINETLYNNDGSQSKQYFKEDPDAFKAYHDGYKCQLEQWPVNPLDVIISSIIKMPADNIIADFGCGEAYLAASVPHEVHSFDFIALNDKVKACDMAHTPLLMSSVHVVVFCLSLMGTNLNDYIMEANRVLKNNGILKLAEVESRFENVEDFIRLLGSYGFKSTWKDLSHNLFYFMDFKKVEDTTMTTRKNFPLITLKPCLYKRR